MKANNTAVDFYSHPPLIRRSKGKVIVHLKSVGNPDYGQDSERDMPGVPNVWAHVGSIKEARSMVEHFIAYFDLGGGNWAGGELTNADGLVIGRISYNGRVWDTSGKEISIDGEKTAAQHESEGWKDYAK